MSEPTMKERLTKIETDMSWLKTAMSNHLLHHEKNDTSLRRRQWGLILVILAAICSAIIAYLV